MSKARHRFWLFLTVALISSLSADSSIPIIQARIPDGAAEAAAGFNDQLDPQPVPADHNAREQEWTQGQAAVYPVHAGFPINTGIWIEKAPPTIADINNDGNNELLVPAYNGKVYGWDASGHPLPGFPLTSIAGWHIRGRLALGDLDHDGNLEIAAGVESPARGVGAKIYIWRPDGTVLTGWPQDTACHPVSGGQYCGIAAIILADIDDDGTLEVIAGTDNRDITNPDPSLYVPNLYVWRSTGQAVAGEWPVEDDHNVAIIGAMAAGDLNGDGKADIVTGRDYNRLFAYDNRGNDLPGWPVYVFWPYDTSGWGADQIEFARSAVTLADLDADGILEYIVPGLRRYANSATYYNTELLVYAPNGQRWRGWETPASGTSPLSNMDWRMLQAPAIGDLNGDKQPDIVVTTQDGWVRAYTPAKQLLWSFDYAQGRLQYASEPVIGDVDGDGWNEVLFGTFDANLSNVGTFSVWILGHNGSIKPGAPLAVDAPGITSAPALADLDSDGKLEIAAANANGKVYVWDAPGALAPARLPWPMARHDSAAHRPVC